MHASILQVGVLRASVAEASVARQEREIKEQAALIEQLSARLEELEAISEHARSALQRAQQELATAVCRAAKLEVVAAGHAASVKASRSVAEAAQRELQDVRAELDAAIHAHRAQVSNVNNNKNTSYYCFESPVLSCSVVALTCP